MARVIETTLNDAKSPDRVAYEVDAMAFRRIVLLALLIVAPGIVWVLLPYAPACAFRATFGVPCPGCGLGHGLAAIFAGHLRAALVAYPALVPLVLGYIVLVMLVATTLGRTSVRSTSRLARAALLSGIVSGATVGVQWFAHLLI